MQEPIELTKTEDLPSFQTSPHLSPLQLQLHSAPKTESGAIDLTKAQRIAEGGTHVLYRFPDASYVIKVMKQNPNAEELETLEKNMPFYMNVLISMGNKDVSGNNILISQCSSQVKRFKFQRYRSYLMNNALKQKLNLILKWSLQNLILS